MDEIDEFLNGETEVTETEATVTPEAEASEVEAEATEEAIEPEATEEPKGEEEPKPEETPSTEEPATVPLAALTDERSKRQAIEAELAALRKVPRPDVMEDPEGAINHIEREMSENLIKTRLDISEDMMRTAHEDYDSVLGAFTEAMQSNPALRDEMVQSPNPARFAYETGQRHQMLQEIGDPNSYRDKVKAEVQAEVEKTIAATVAEQVATALKERASIPESLVGERSSAPRNDPGFSGPTSLDNILN